jgi:hypothetical protein
MVVNILTPRFLCYSLIRTSPNFPYSYTSQRRQRPLEGWLRMVHESLGDWSWVNLTERHALQPKMATCCHSEWFRLERLMWLYINLWCITFLAWICDSFVAYHTLFTSSLLQNSRGKGTHETNVEETIWYGNQAPVNVSENVLEICFMIQKINYVVQSPFCDNERSSGSTVLC